MLPKGVVVFADARAATAADRRRRAVPALDEVANRPIAHHVLDALHGVGVQDVILAGPADVLIDVGVCLRGYASCSRRLACAVCEDELNIVSALQAAVPLVGDAPCVVHLADGLLGEPLARYVSVLGKDSPDLTVLCHDATGPEIVQRAGIGVFGPGAAWKACHGQGQTEKAGLELLAERVANGGGCVQIRPADDWRRYRGDPDDLLELNRLALDTITQQPRTAPGEMNRIEGRVQIDPTASISGSVIVGPVVVGAHAHVANAYIGPYTSVGVRARIEGAEIERSIISPGASVMHVGERLASSVVGRNARVFRAFSLPRALRLRVSEGDEVALC